MTNSTANIPMRGVFYGQLRESCTRKTHAFSYLRQSGQAAAADTEAKPAVKARVMAKYPGAAMGTAAAGAAALRPSGIASGYGTATGASIFGGAGYSAGAAAAAGYGAGAAGYSAGAGMTPSTSLTATAQSVNLPSVGASASGQIRPGGRGRPASIINVSTVNSGTNEIKDTIRIVVKDAKAPTAVRGMQKVMRFICIVALILVCSLGAPRFFGVQEFNIITGSMTPTYPVGTLVFVQPKAADTIRPGEVVSYVANENLDIITHRCTGQNYDDKTLTTRGDANNAEDAPVLYENVVGVVSYSIPYVGGVVDYLTNDQIGRVVLVGILMTILALTIMAEQMSSYLTKKKANVFSKGGSELETSGMKVKKVRRGRKKKTVTTVNFANPTGAKPENIKLNTGALSAKDSKAARKSKAKNVTGTTDKKRK